MKGKMKAWNFIEPEKMYLEERDIPQIADDEVLVKVKAVGICGSDVSYYWQKWCGEKYFNKVCFRDYKT